MKIQTNIISYTDGVYYRKGNRIYLLENTNLPIGFKIKSETIKYHFNH